MTDPNLQNLRVDDRVTLVHPSPAFDSIITGTITKVGDTIEVTTAKNSTFYFARADGKHAGIDYKAGQCIKQPGTASGWTIADTDCPASSGPESVLEAAVKAGKRVEGRRIIDDTDDTNTD